MHGTGRAGRSSLETPDGAGLRGGGGRRSPEVQRIIEALSGDRRTAERTFWDLAQVDARWIPELVQEVSSEEMTALERITFIVSDRNFVRHGKLFLISDIPGMGLMEEFEDDGQATASGYTKKSYGLAKNGRDYKVVMDNFHGFPLGTVMRAALRNRFTMAIKLNGLDGPRYPIRIDHRRQTRSWWWAYYRNMKDDLELPREWRG